MYNHILLPLALSDKDEIAVDAVISMNLPSGSKITLLHVVEPLRDTPYEQVSDFYRELEATALEKMMVSAVRLSAAGLTPSREIIYGDRASKVVEFITERGITLVVLGSHQVDLTATRNQLGTISQKVALFAPCPVLLVR